MAIITTSVRLPVSRRSNTPLQINACTRVRLPGGIGWQVGVDAPAFTAAQSWVIAKQVNALIWGTRAAALSLDHAWIIFTLPGGAQLYAIEQENWATLAASMDVCQVAWIDANHDLVPKLTGAIAPPTPPIIVVTSDNGGEGLTIGFGSNPYTLQVGFQALTKTVTMYFFGFGAGSSTPHHPGPPDGGLPPAAMYPLGTPDWRKTGFPGAGSDHWPLLAWYDPAMNPSGLDNPTDWNEFSVWWPAWRTPAFGVTADWPGHGTRFDPEMVWDSDNQVSGFLSSNDFTRHFTEPPGTVPTSIQDDICIRGDLSLPPLPAGTTVTAIAWNSFVSRSFHAADVFLNDVDLNGYFAGIGTDPSGLLTGLNIDTTAGIWNWGGYNLLSMLATSDYVAGQLHGGVWVGIVFSLDNHTSYRPPPTGWQTGGGTFTTVIEGTPIPYFGHSVAHSIDFGDIGAGGREYYRKQFTLPDVAITGGVLSITAETGIGSIWINDIRVDVGSRACNELTNLYVSQTVLTFPIPAPYLLRNASNTLAVQLYSSTGLCKLAYSLVVR